MSERPLLRYHGGKFRLAPWILTHLPPHRSYVEPFAGAGSIFFQKPRSPCEVLNELDGNIVNVYRVLRDSARALELRRRLELTPYARDEFEWSYEEPVDDIDRAHKAIIRSFMGQGSDGITRGYRTGFRCKPSAERQTAAHEWAGWPAQVPFFLSRLQGVLLENCDALKLIPRLDAVDVLTYCDPPYVLSTRSAAKSRHGYRHEMTDADHVALAAVLHACTGMVVLSGYPSELYNDLYRDWIQTTTESRADQNRPRTEVLWMNPLAAAGQRQHRLIA
jgi:DNA adenine methylase